jgi:gas vesicle protein
MKIRIIKESLDEGAEEFGAAVGGAAGRALDLAIAPLMKAGAEAKTKAIRSLASALDQKRKDLLIKDFGGYTKQEVLRMTSATAQTDQRPPYDRYASRDRDEDESSVDSAPRGSF